MLTDAEILAEKGQEFLDVILLARAMIYYVPRSGTIPTHKVPSLKPIRDWPQERIECAIYKGLHSSDCHLFEIRHYEPMFNEDDVLEVYSLLSIAPIVHPRWSDWFSTPQFSGLYGAKKELDND
jgi:hypothetical protein